MRRADWNAEESRARHCLKSVGNSGCWEVHFILRGVPASILCVVGGAPAFAFRVHVGDPESYKRAISSVQLLMPNRNLETATEFFAVVDNFLYKHDCDMEDLMQ